MKVFKLAVVLLSGFAAVTVAEDGVDEEEVPEALTHYLGREIAQTMHWKGAGWLLRATREREENAELMLKELKLEEGMVVCDMGSGNGYHSLKMAKTVGEKGKIVAVDAQPEMLEMLKVRAKAEGIENVETVRGAFHDPRLEDRKFDLMLMVDVYHEFSYPVEMLAKMRAALKPDGVVVLVEYRGEDDWVPIKKLHKMTKAQVDKEMVANGFKRVRSFEGLPWQHLLFYGLGEPAEAEVETGGSEPEGE
ncbi:MAG: class I SAM-dependent methyltransferase [Verrucomicrobiales bacterium]|nr:class I SAM-dependent methyltransferase [Verrucomicrobiales bacterium]